MTKRYVIKSAETDILDTSTMTEKSRMEGDTRFTIQRWNDKPGLFDTSEVEVFLGTLPPNVVECWNSFTAALTEHLMIRESEK